MKKDKKFLAYVKRRDKKLFRFCLACWLLHQLDFDSYFWTDLDQHLAAKRDGESYESEIYSQLGMTAGMLQDIFAILDEGLMIDDPKERKLTALLKISDMLDIRKHVVNLMKESDWGVE